MFVAICDGACSGNPGPASIGVVIWERFKAGDGQKTRPSKTISESIGVATNNDAEWKAVLFAARYVATHEINHPAFLYSDSQLVVYQANGKWKAKTDSMREYKRLYDTFINAAKRRGQEVTLSWLPRQLTHLADRQAARAQREVVGTSS